MDFEEGIATFKSEALQNLQMSSGSGGSWLDKQEQQQKQHGSALSDQDHDHDKLERWDPVMTSLLKANNARAESSGTGRPSSYSSNSYLQQQQQQHSGSSPLQLGGFSDLDSNLQVPTIHLGSTGTQPAIAPALNAPSSAGASATKVSKKRSRASRRPPTTVLEADSANFRSMVQHLTGIPAPPPMLAAPPSSLHHHLSPSSRFDFLGVGIGSSGLVRPQPTRHFSASTSSFGIGSGFNTATQLLALDHHTNTTGRGLLGHPPAHFTQQQLTTSLTKLDDLRSSFSYNATTGAPYPGCHDNLDSTLSTSDTSSSTRNLISTSGFRHHSNSSTTAAAAAADTTTPGGVLYAASAPSHGESGVSNAAAGASASAASCLSMPVVAVPTMPSLALWECDAPGGGGLSVSNRSRIKREVEVGVAEEASGRPMASWSTSL